MKATDRKIPIRKCIGCNERFEKGQLVRVIRTPEGEIKLDLTGKMNGRGAYICKSPACLKKAEKQRRLDSTLGQSIPKEIYAKLLEELS